MNIQRRTRTGSAIAELPGVLWVLFVLILYPLLDLATVSMRYTFMVTTSREAVMAASRSTQFYSDASSTQPSARNAATNIANNAASRFTGIKVTNVATALVVTNLANNSVTRYTSPIAQSSIDASNNLYSYEVTVTGTVAPLLTFNLKGYAAVPGLTTPLPVSISSQKMCENTQGLYL